MPALQPHPRSHPCHLSRNALNTLLLLQDCAPTAAAATPHCTSRPPCGPTPRHQLGDGDDQCGCLHLEGREEGIATVGATHTWGAPSGRGPDPPFLFGACLLLLYSRCGVVGTPHGGRMYRACCLLLPEVVAAPHTRLSHVTPSTSITLRCKKT